MLSIKIVFIIFIVVLIVFSAKYPWWFLPKKGLVILMYHHIGDKNDRWFVNENMFEKQMNMLKKYNFTPITFKDLEDFHYGKTTLPKKPVLITFDDGWEDNYRLAFPILKKTNMKANIFLTYNYVNSGKKEYINWQQIEEMKQSGLVNFGSHLMDHKRLNKIPVEEQKYQLTESKKMLEEKLGYKITSFAFPHGDGAFDSDVRKLVQQTGYLFDYSVRRGITKLSVLKQEKLNNTLRRITVEYGQTMFDFYLQITRGRHSF